MNNSFEVCILVWGLNALLLRTSLFQTPEYYAGFSPAFLAADVVLGIVDDITDEP